MEILRTLSLAVFLNLCYALEIPCNVSQTPQRTIYRVPEFKAVACDYQWANTSGHVLSNQKNKTDDLVLNSSETSVTITKCLPRLNYTRDCISERIQRTAYCVTYCMTPRPLKKEGTPRHYRYTITSFSITALLILLVLLGCLCRYFSAVLKRNSPPTRDNVEAQ